MSMPIPLRCDFHGFKLRRLASPTKDAAQAWRLLALAEIYESGHLEIPPHPLGFMIPSF